MKTAVISMVRNEADVIETWLRHQFAMFDYVLVADHLSTDGTYEFLSAAAQSEPRLRVLRYKERAYDQHTVLNLLRSQTLVDWPDFDWLFVLDADEFLSYSTRDDFISAISTAQAHDVLAFQWRNFLPTDPGVITPQLHGRKAKGLSRYGKVALSRNIAADLDYMIPKGAHKLKHKTLGSINGYSMGELIHIPIRSTEQIWNKVLQGCESYLNVPDYNGREGSHWFDTLNHLLSYPTDWTMAEQLLHEYGAARAKVDLESASLAFQESSILLQTAPLAKPALEGAANLTPELQPLNNQRLRRIMQMDKRGLLKQNIAIVGDNIRDQADLADRTFRSLPGLAVQPFSIEKLIDALQSAFWDIKHRPATAWAEHIPFMFSLFTLLRPRTFVELGVHNGASFLAACQAVERDRIPCECVAIDNWLGDPHAGSHEPSVFTEFRRNLEPFTPFAGYLRMNFAEALPQFEDRSIDVLHVDGYHTANAVRQDFDLWLAKMSDQGIILFHDTNEFKADFGVWRFWRLIREQYPHVEFGHGHGLGILIVGKNSPARIGLSDDANVSLLSRNMNDLLQVLFGNVGKLSWANQITSHQTSTVTRAPASTPQARAPIAPSPAVINEMQGRIDLLENRVRKYDRSLYGRVRNGIRKIRLRLKGVTED